MKFDSVFAKATSLKILQTLCLIFRNKWWYAKLIPIFASAVKLLKYYFEEPQSCPRWMLQKCLKLRGSWIAQDLVCLIMHYLQLSDVLDDGPELVVLSFIRTAWKKTLYLLKNFQRRKEWAVSCRKSLSLVCCQKDMELWTPAAHRPWPLDHAANNEQVHWVQIWIVQWSMTLCIFIHETDREGMWKLAASLACSYSLPPTLMDDDSALIAQAYQLIAAAGKQCKELCLACLIQ